MNIFAVVLLSKTQILGTTDTFEYDASWTVNPASNDNDDEFNDQDNDLRKSNNINNNNHSSSSVNSKHKSENRDMHRSKYFSKTSCISSDKDIFDEINLHGATDNLHVITVIDVLFVTVVRSEFAAFDHDGTNHVVSFSLFFVLCFFSVFVFCQTVLCVFSFFEMSVVFIINNDIMLLCVVIIHILLMQLYNHRIGEKNIVQA